MEGVVALDFSPYLLVLHFSLNIFMAPRLPGRQEDKLTRTLHSLCVLLHSFQIVDYLMFLNL
jgi:hypothetical protein